jgi:hypothetical protein
MLVKKKLLMNCKRKETSRFQEMTPCVNINGT